MSIQTERTNNQNFPMNRRSLLNKNWDQKLNTSKRTGLSVWIEAAKESSINARFYIFNIFNTKFNMFIEGCLGGGEGILFRS